MPNKPSVLLLRLPSTDAKSSVWELDLKDVTVAPKPRPAKDFPAAVTLGDSNDPKKPYLLDLSELAHTMERWVQHSRAAGTGGESTATTSAEQTPELVGRQAGPHDIVYPVVVGEKPAERFELRLIRMKTVRETDGKISSLTPTETEVVDYRPTRAAMRALFRSGAILMYLPQTTFPIGVTCYLLNLLALDGVDIDQLG